MANSGRLVHVQYRGVAAYIDRADPAAYAAWLDGVDVKQNDENPRLHDHVIVNKYRGSQDDSGCIAFVRTGAEYNGRNYYVSSGNMPYCGSIGDWFRADEITVRRRG